MSSISRLLNRRIIAMSTGTHLTNVATIRRVAAIHTVTTIKDKMAHVENDYPMVEDSHANNDKFVKAGSGESGPTDAGKAVLIIMSIFNFTFAALLFNAAGEYEERKEEKKAD